MHQRNCSTSLANLTKTTPPPSSFGYLQILLLLSLSFFFFYFRRFSTFLVTRLPFPLSTFLFVSLSIFLGSFDGYLSLLSFLLSSFSFFFFFFFFFLVDLWRFAFQFSRNSSFSCFFGNWESPRRFVFSDFCRVWISIFFGECGFFLSFFCFYMYR